MVRSDFGKVRILHDNNPFGNYYDIRVEWMVDDKWELYQGFNSISDDYAYTNARIAAGNAIKTLAANAANNLPGHGVCLQNEVKTN